jgi:hypothetical protein
MSEIFVITSKKLADPSGAMLPTSDTILCCGQCIGGSWSTAARIVRPVPSARTIGAGERRIRSR